MRFYVWLITDEPIKDSDIHSVLFLGDYLSSVHACVCVSRANAMQADIIIK